MTPLADSIAAIISTLFSVDGKMIDIAFYDGAKRTLALEEASGVYREKKS